ncbi:MAG: hypothetical protein GY950_05650, partial [bacterium]|nr:hypothetical protein [bacterium]
PGSTTVFELGEEETNALNKMARANGVTLFMMLLSAFNVFLSKISGQEDIVVGTPVAGRRHADLERIIGMFVNTLAMRNYPTGSQTLREFLNRVKTRTLEAFENQEYQFEDLVEKAAVNRDISRNPLFDAEFVLQNMGAQTAGIPKVEIPGLEVKPYENTNLTAKFDLGLFCAENGQHLDFTFRYGTKLFRKETIETFTGYFKRVVAAAAKDTDRKISGIALISEEEMGQLLYDFNNTGWNNEPGSPVVGTIHEGFEQQAARVPG